MTFGNHPFVRNFFAITERDDIDGGRCTSDLTWRDVQNISGFCGGLRRNIQNKHRLLYELRVKFAKPQWLQRTKTNPVAWLCAQKRPLQGLWKALTKYKYKYNAAANENNAAAPAAGDDDEVLPDFLVIMDDDTYYNMGKVIEGLLELQKQQLNDHHDSSGMVIAGCAIRSRLKHFKWSFPFGGWGTIFSKRALQAILYPLRCGHSDSASRYGISNATITGAPQQHQQQQQQQGGTTTTTTTTTTEESTLMNERFCPKLLKDRIGEYQVYQDGMSLAEIMYTYVMKEPYVDHAHWKLGFCLHSDWVWGYMVNYYNISVAMGRRSKDLIVDRLGAYNGSEINPPYSDALLKLRRQCDFDSDYNCSTEAHMCHYVTPQHMKYLSSSSSQQQQQQQQQMWHG